MGYLAYTLLAQISVKYLPYYKNAPVLTLTYYSLAHTDGLWHEK